MESIWSILSLQKWVRASWTTVCFDCTKAEAPVKRKCYRNFGEQGRIIGQLVTMWKSACDISPETCSTSAAATIDMPVLNEICLWTRTYCCWHTSPSCSYTNLWSTARRKCSIISQWRQLNCSSNGAKSFGIAAFTLSGGDHGNLTFISFHVQHKWVSWCNN